MSLFHFFLMNVHDTKPCVTLNLFQCALFVLFVPKVFLHILYSFPGSVCKVVKHSQNVTRFEKNITSRAQHCYLAFIQARRGRRRRLRRRESDAWRFGSATRTGGPESGGRFSGGNKGRIGSIQNTLSKSGGLCGLYENQEGCNVETYSDQHDEVLC